MSKTRPTELRNAKITDRYSFTLSNNENINVQLEKNEAKTKAIHKVYSNLQTIKTVCKLPEEENQSVILRNINIINIFASKLISLQKSYALKRQTKVLFEGVTNVSTAILTLLNKEPLLEELKVLHQQITEPTIEYQALKIVVSKLANTQNVHISTLSRELLTIVEQFKTALDEKNQADVNKYWRVRGFVLIIFVMGIMGQFIDTNTRNISSLELANFKAAYGFSCVTTVYAKYVEEKDHEMRTWALPLSLLNWQLPIIPLLLSDEVFTFDKSKLRTDCTHPKMKGFYNNAQSYSTSKQYSEWWPEDFAEDYQKSSVYHTVLEDINAIIERDFSLDK
jgi:hypothetical protein